MHHGRQPMVAPTPIILQEEEEEEEDHSEEERADERKIMKASKRFYPIALQAWESTYDRWEKIKNKLVKNSKDEEEAEDEAFDKMSEKHHHAFFDVYSDFLIKALYLRKSKLHQKVLEHAVELHSRDAPVKIAVKTVIKKYRDEFDEEMYVRNASTHLDSEEEDEAEESSSNSSETSSSEEEDSDEDEEMSEEDEK